MSVAAPRATPRPWSLAGALALLGAALLASEAVILAGWVADGPHQITAFRSHGDTAWWAARAVEVLVLASVAAFVVHAVRERRRCGRLGADGLLMAGMLSAAFWDPVYNWRTPAWLYSSDFLNVNDWLAHAPGVTNPAMGHQPWPVVIVLVGYPLWGVGFAMLVNVVMRRAGGSAARAAAAGLVAAVAITVASFSVFKALDLMSAPGFRFGVLGDSDVLFAGMSGGVVFWGLACVRHFRDRDGRAIFQRGGGRTSLLAAIGTCQLIVVLGWGVLTVPFTTHADPYPALPAHLLNGVCQAGTAPSAAGSCGADGAGAR